MKKLLKFFRNVLFIILGLLVGIIVFLYIFYAIQEKKIERENAELQQRNQDRLIQSDSISLNSGSQFLQLIPVPKKIEITEGSYRMPDTLYYATWDSLTITPGDYLKRNGFSARSTPDNHHIVFIFTETLPDQGYTLKIGPDQIQIGYSKPVGLYYAIVSLKILNRNYNGNIPCVYIEDHPDLATRGVMLDISRDKIPTLNTLKDRVQLLADLKFNHLELYIEGFSFAYPSFKNLWDGKETPLTGTEIQTLDSLCRERFIDLIPNQNSLGHMTAWLATDQFSDLAECPKGYKLMGLMDMKSTLNPLDPNSMNLVTQMTDDLLPNFTSSSFNVNLDEPFELGKGKSKRMVRRSGMENVYLDYALKIHEMTAQRSKKMLMWGDIVMRYPEILRKLPKDITLLDWGYEAEYPFEKNCKTLQSSDIQYIVCPGTSSWTSITGRTNNMIANIASATVNGFKYGAGGMLLTDWGDMGHWQYPAISYPAYTAGSALSWNSQSTREFPLVGFLNNYIFQDERSIMGDLVLDLGRYKQFEEIPLPNMTTTMLTLQFGIQDHILVNALYKKIGEGIMEMMIDIAPEMVYGYLEKYESRKSFDFNGIFTFLDEKEALLNNVILHTSDGKLIIDEYRNAIRLVRIGAGLQYYVQNRNNLNVQEQKDQLRTLHTNLLQYLNENHRLWMIRNKPGGYDRSTAALNTLLKQIEEQTLLADKGLMERTLNRFIEKITTAASVIYLSLI